MISSEVQRTLVKSPPELWAELSDPDALARHLGELGKIRIIRVEPESLVEWASGGVSGTIALKASGWGTKVTLTATSEAQGLVTETESCEGPAVTAAERFGEEHPATLLGSALGRAGAGEPETPPPAAPAAEEPLTEPPAAAAAEEPPTEPAAAPAAEEPAPQAPVAEASPEPKPAPAPAPAPPGRGFFARLFGRRQRAGTAAPAPEASGEIASPLAPEPRAPLAPEPPAPETPPAPAAPATPAALSAPAAPELSAEPEQTPAEAPGEEREPEVAEADPAPVAGDRRGGLAAELEAAETVAAEDVRTILTGVLDRLGAAHHRPFSRS